MNISWQKLEYLEKRKKIFFLSWDVKEVIKINSIRLVYLSYHVVNSKNCLLLNGTHPLAHSKICFRVFTLGLAGRKNRFVSFCSTTQGLVRHEDCRLNQKKIWKNWFPFSKFENCYRKKNFFFPNQNQANF